MVVASARMGFFGLVWRILDGLRRVLHLVLLLVIFGFILAALHTSIPIVPHTAALVIAPEGRLVEQLATDPVRRAFGQAAGGPAPETLLRDVTDAIIAAKSDARIKLIVLDLGSLDASGLSKLQEVGAALREFRAAGKRVVAAADSMDQTQYYLAAQAGEVYLDPMGLIYLDGFSYYRMYLKDAIEKLGVDVNVFRAGTYKSFTDQFSRSDMAPTEREETTVWLEALWNAYQQDVTRARSMPAGALNDFVANEPAALAAVNGDAAKLALQRGLVTALKSRRQMADELKALVGEDEDNHSFNAVGMSQYLASVRSKHVLKSKSDSKVGIVVASGEILDGHQPPGTIGGESTADLLRQARYDKGVKAVVLRVDSPGGSMFASEQILREVQNLRSAGKPVVVSMSTYAASGGYYISTAANEIFASPTTLTGSIGVFSVVPTFQHTLEKLGVKVDGIGTTPLAGGMRSGSHAYARHAPDSPDFSRSRVCAILAARRRRPEKIGRGCGQDRAGAGMGGSRRSAHRLGGSSRRTQGCDRRCRENRSARRRLRRRLHRAGLEFARGVVDAAALGDAAHRSTIGTHCAAWRHRSGAGPRARAGARHRKAQRSARVVCVLLVPRTAHDAQGPRIPLRPGLDLT